MYIYIYIYIYGARTFERNSYSDAFLLLLLDLQIANPIFGTAADLMPVTARNSQCNVSVSFVLFFCYEFLRQYIQLLGMILLELGVLSSPPQTLSH